jgi:hypothetical protein
VACVILILILMKNMLQGFMALFPFMGVIAAYESRHSLWAVCRQMHGVALQFIPMLVVCRLLQPSIGGWALVPGWVVYGISTFLVTRALWGSERATAVLEAEIYQQNTGV